MPKHFLDQTQTSPQSRPAIVSARLLQTARRGGGRRARWFSPNCRQGCGGGELSAGSVRLPGARSGGPAAEPLAAPGARTGAGVVSGAQNPQRLSKTCCCTLRRTPLNAAICSRCFLYLLCSVQNRLGSSFARKAFWGRLLCTAPLPGSWRILFPKEDQRQAQWGGKPFRAQNNDANGPRVAFVSLHRTMAVTRLRGAGHGRAARHPCGNGIAGRFHEL